jgi:hypothetical protein
MMVIVVGYSDAAWRNNNNAGERVVTLQSDPNKLGNALSIAAERTFRLAWKS